MLKREIVREREKENWKAEKEKEKERRKKRKEKGIKRGMRGLVGPVAGQLIADGRGGQWQVQRGRQPRPKEDGVQE